MCQAVQELIEEGENKGKFKLLLNMIKKGRLTLEEAASDIGISVKQLLDNFKEYNLTLEK